MTRTSFVLMVAMVLALGVGIAYAAPNGNGNGYRVAEFIDENGDGFNDLAPDADGDGIPNGLDSDYERPQDGSGNGFGRQVDGPYAETKGLRSAANWDFAHYFFFGPFGPYVLEAPGNQHGPADGNGFGGDGPADGSGFGPGSGSGTGDCDGTGPNGQQGPVNDRGNRR